MKRETGFILGLTAATAAALWIFKKHYLEDENAQIERLENDIHRQLDIIEDRMKQHMNPLS